MNCRVIQFQNHTDERGQLVVLEEKSEIPFKVKRIYYLSKTKYGIRRGFHSHRRLEQVLICAAGKCFVHVDDGKDKKDYCLDSPFIGLYIGNNIWREMYDFSEDALLIVLASDIYDETDYIRDYSEFLRIIDNGVK